MEVAKASDVVTIRDILRSEKQEAALLEKLSPIARDIYITTLATKWIDVSAEAEILMAAAEILYPGGDLAFKQLGHRVATESLSGVYQVIFKIPSVIFVINRVPMLWSLLSKKGKITVALVEPKKALVTMVEYPELPPYQRQYIAGYAEAIMELTGVHHAEVRILESKPEAWQWEAIWD